MKTSTEFDGYVARLERVARDDPRGYRRRVLLFGVLGYAYVFGMLALLLALVAGLVALVISLHGGFAILGKLLIPAALLVWTILRAMWVPLGAPDGREVRPSDAPLLFEEVETIRQAVEAPRAHHILLTDDFNAAVAQVPRLGMFGWHRNYLMLGVPLMHALPADEFRAVVAHEFGHLSRAHGRAGAWTYRIRATWDRILAQLREQEHGATFLYERFFGWYAPRFAAYSFVLARAHEFEADARAAELVGRGVMASALTRVEVISRYVQNTFWPAVWRRAIDEPEPPADAIVALARTVGEPVPSTEAELLVDEALATPTRSGDTHPALGERLAALHVAPGPELIAARPGVPSAATVYLERAAAEAIQRMSGAWLESARPGWADQHRRARESIARLAELEALAAAGPLEANDARELGWLVASLRGSRAAIPHFRALAEAAPDDPETHAMLGRLLLECDDEEGLQHMELAMRGGIGYVSHALAGSYAFLRRAGRHDEAEACWRRLQEHEDLMSAARAERDAGIGVRDTFLPHGVEDDAVRAIAEGLRRHADIASAFLVRKALETLPDQPLYVLAIVPDWTWKRGVAGDHGAALIKRLIQEIPVPGDTVVLTLEKEMKPLRKRLASIQGAEVYVRGRRSSVAP